MHIDAHRIFVHAGVDRFKPLDQQDSQVLLWKLYDGNDEGGHDRRHVVHGHHQFEAGPIKHPGRTDLDTFAWYTGRLVVGVFDDEMARAYRLHRSDRPPRTAWWRGGVMAKTSIVDEIEHHPQFCLDLSDPLGAIRMGNSIGRLGDHHPVPAF